MRLLYYPESVSVSSSDEDAVCKENEIVNHHYKDRQNAVRS